MRFATLIALVVLVPRGSGQSWPCLTCPESQPPDSVTASTNRFDLDANGTTDFEIVNRQETTYYADLSGWLPRTSTTITLVPNGGCQILVSDVSDLFAGDVPILARGDEIGVASSGRHWGAEGRVLVNRVEPTFLFGPLAPVWNGAPGRFYLGINLGNPEAPIYGWLCFTRDRGMTPINWGYSREPSAPVIAGDPGTAPEFKLKMGLTEFGHLPWLSWEPGFGGVIVEEGVLESGVVWDEVENPSDPEYRVPNLILDGSAPPGEVRLFRLRLGP
ncbi:MAG TPA: hypothetical protein DCE44_00135 [Verrucomicrobiales bacterium]|nr:hypothetical protein [Verrucomicrobiales bacterium]